MNAGDPVFSTGNRQIETKTAAAARAALSVQGTAEKGVANGYASLGADGKVPAAQIPTVSSDPATYIHAATEKTPENDDEFTFVDSAASWVLRKIKWSSMVSIFSGLFSAIGHTHAGVYEPADADIQAHVTGTGSPHTPAGIGAEVAGAAATAVGSHESSYNHALLHSPVTVGEGLNLFGQYVTNTDLGSVAVTGHEADYDHTKLHDPVTVSGNGISLAGQQVSLDIGSGATQVAAGNHLHAGVYDAAGEATGAVADHEEKFDHSKIHDPVTVVGGNGLVLFGQQVSLEVGPEVGHVASGVHTHTQDQITGVEPALGNPATTGFVLSSTDAGVRSWVSKGAGDFLATLVNTEVTLNGAATATLNKMHLITDSASPADYSIALPAVSGNAGKFVGFRVSNAATKFFTIDPDGTEKIWCKAGEVSTRVYSKCETVILQCDGTQWHVIYETMREVGFKAYDDAAQSCNSGANTIVNCVHEEWDIGGCYDGTNKFTPNAPGIYRLTANVALDSLGADKAIFIFFMKNGSGYWYSLAQIIAVATTPMVTASLEVSANGTTDYFQFGVYHDHGSARNTYVGYAQWYPQFSATRIRRELS